MAKQPTNAVTKIETPKPQENKALAMKSNATEVSADVLDDIEGVGGAGLENVTSRDLIIPRMLILQKLSPQLEPKKPEYIEGAKVGMFCDTATGDLFSELLFLPCYFATVYLEWAPRNTGKGLVNNHGMNASIMEGTKQDERRRNVLPNGNYIAETATYYGLNISAGGRRCFLPLTSTQLKASRQLMTQITTERVEGRNGPFQPPIYYRARVCTTVDQSNNDGDWVGWKFDPGPTVFELDPSKALLREAKDFYEQARSGLVQGDLASFGEDLASGSTKTVDHNAPM